MSGEREVKTGKITISKTSFLKAKTWIGRCCTLYDKTDTSPAKLQLTDENNPGAELKTFILEDVSSIQKKSKSKNCQVEINWRKEKFSFLVDSEQEANSWIDHLNQVTGLDKKANKKISAENLSTSSLVSDDTEIFVNNTEYQSLDMWTYNVEMSDTDASLRCQLFGPYRLQLTKQGFFLLTINERRVLYQWPYHFIRRFGKSQNTFTIQAGRKCESGEGSFCFATKPGESLEIFQRVNQLTLQLKASQNELAADNSPTPRGTAKPEIKRTFSNPPVEINHSQQMNNNLWVKKVLPYQSELQHKLSSHADTYSNVNISSLPSPDVSQVKLPQVFKHHNLYSDIEVMSRKMTNLSTNPTEDSNTYSSLEVNNNDNHHPTRPPNVPNQSTEEDYDRLDFNIIETPLQERQKTFKPYIYDSVRITNQEENLYEEAAPFTDERNACGGKLLPVPVVMTQKPFMEPTTIDDGYR